MKKFIFFLRNITEVIFIVIIIQRTSGFINVRRILYCMVQIDVLNLARMKIIFLSLKFALYNHILKIIIRHRLSIFRNIQQYFFVDPEIG